jgi:hypothetical protein
VLTRVTQGAAPTEVADDALTNLLHVVEEDSPDTEVAITILSLVHRRARAWYVRAQTDTLWDDDDVDIDYTTAPQ